MSTVNLYFARKSQGTSLRRATSTWKKPPWYEESLLNAELFTAFESVISWHHLFTLHQQPYCITLHSQLSLRCLTRNLRVHLGHRRQEQLEPTRRAFLRYVILITSDCDGRALLRNCSVRKIYDIDNIWWRSPGKILCAIHISGLYVLNKSRQCGIVVVTVT